MNPIYQGAFPGTMEKGRVVLPTRLRDIYEVKTRLPRDEMVLYGQPGSEVYNGIQFPLLRIFDDKLALFKELSADKSPLSDLLDHNFINLSELSVDKTYRVSIPIELRDSLRLDGRVVFVGAENHIQLVNKMFWDMLFKPVRRGAA